MKVSPCGWFCFEEPAHWICEDTPNSIRLSRSAYQASIQIISARKNDKIRETDIWDMLEDEWPNPGSAPFEETSMYRLDSGLECLRSLQGNDTELHGMAIVFWSNYCVQMRLNAHAAPRQLQDCIADFDSILENLQSLTLD